MSLSTMSLHREPRSAPLLPPIAIGPLAKRLGVTQRALRFYEDRGLITSDRGKLSTRVYDAKTVKTIELITTLRRVDISLYQIQALLKTCDDQALFDKTLAGILDAKKQQHEDSADQLRKLMADFAVRSPKSAVTKHRSAAEGGASPQGVPAL